MLRDWNRDGHEDIFTYHPTGIKAYTYVADTVGFHFELVQNFNPGFGFNTNVDFLFHFSYGYISNIIFPSIDYPAIDDIDNDGDLDILAFGCEVCPYAAFITWFKNTSIELTGSTDTLSFTMVTECWGNFAESVFTNNIVLNQMCRPDGTPPDGTIPLQIQRSSRHTGSTVLTLDLDGDNDRDVILGDYGYASLKAVINGGDSTSANATTVDTLFPGYNIPALMDTFPASFYFDADFDGKKDLIVAPNDYGLAFENFNNVLYYKNNGTTNNPIFDYQTKRMFVGDMIEVGSGAHPTFADINGDGEMDLVIGNYGYYNPAFQFSSGLAYYKNIGSGLNPIFELVTRDLGNLSSFNLFELAPAFLDVDADGDLDLFVGDQQGQLHLFENIAGPGVQADFQLVTMNYNGIDVGSNATPFFADVDRDGDPDLLVGEKNGNINLFINTDSAINLVFSSTPDNDMFGNIDVTLPTENFGYSSPVVTPLDSTGENYMLVGTNRGDVLVFRGLDSNLTGNFVQVNTLKIEGSRIGLGAGDLNNDGKIDLVVGDNLGGCYLFLKETDSIAIIDTTSVRELEPQSRLFIFPNPAKDQVNVMIKSARAGNATLLVFDVFGRQLLNETYKIGSASETVILQTNTLSPGIYIVRCTAPDGGKMEEKLIIR